MPRDLFSGAVPSPPSRAGVSSRRFTARTLPPKIADIICEVQEGIFLAARLAEPSAKHPHHQVHRSATHPEAPPSAPVPLPVQATPHIARPIPTNRGTI